MPTLLDFLNAAVRICADINDDGGEDGNLESVLAFQNVVPPNYRAWPFHKAAISTCVHTFA